MVARMGTRYQKGIRYNDKDYRNGELNSENHRDHQIGSENYRRKFNFNDPAVKCEERTHGLWWGFVWNVWRWLPSQEAAAHKLVARRTDDATKIKESCCCPDSSWQEKAAHGPAWGHPGRYGSRKQTVTITEPVIGRTEEEFVTGEWASSWTIGSCGTAW